MTTKTGIVILCGITLLTSPLYAAATCGEQVKVQYQQAMAEENVQQRIAKLLPLTEQCEHYPLFSSLGYNYYQQKQYEDADFWFRKAAGLSFAKNVDRANAYQWLGTISEEQNDLPQASEYFRIALNFQDNSELKEHLIEINFQLATQGYTVNQINHIFTSPSCVFPSLFIHFNYNGIKLSKVEEEKIDRLCKVLMGKQFRHSTFRLIGHTDSTGSEAYNMELSLRRAKVVEKHLRKCGVLSKYIKIEGKGESKLRYFPENSNREKYLNRRVEIIQVKSNLRRNK